MTSYGITWDWDVLRWGGVAIGLRPRSATYMIDDVSMPFEEWLSTMKANGKEAEAMDHLRRMPAEIRPRIPEKEGEHGTAVGS